MININRINDIKNNQDLISFINLNSIGQTMSDILILKTYSISKIFNYDKLKSEIINSDCVEDLNYVAGTTMSLYIYGKQIINELNLDSLINNHEYLTLDELKEIRIKEVDKKTTSIIDQGFYFDGFTFSLSIQAQSNLTNIKSNKSLFSSLNLFPLQMSTKSNDIYFLSESNVDVFFMYGLNKVKSAYVQGGILKQSIKSSLTKDDLNLIIDSR